MPVRPVERPVRSAHLGAVFFLLLSGCGAADSGRRDAPYHALSLAELDKAPINAVSPEVIAETFAINSPATDVQRENMHAALVGAVIEWNIPIYDIQRDADLYKITTQPFPIESHDAIPLLRAVVTISPRDDADLQVLHGAKTNDVLQIRGQIRDIALRTVVVIQPAVLAAHPRAGPAIKTSPVEAPL